MINERTGEPFHYSSIQNILRNIMYMGILRSGETKSKIFPELQIIAPEQFERVEKGRQQRAADYEAKCVAAWQKEVVLQDGSEVEVNRPPRMCPKRNTGKSLLSGNVFCGHCGGRIFSSTARKAHHPTPGKPNERIIVYKCYNRTQHKQNCDGPTTYRTERVDQVVESLLRGIFERAKSINEKSCIKQQVQVSAQQYQQKLKKAKADYSKAAKELTKWEDLMLASIEGTCVFTPQQIKNRMDAVQTTLDDLTQQITVLQDQAQKSAELASDIQEQHQRLLSWAEMYDSASQEEKRMVASYIIKAVTLTRDYGIQVEFNISEAQYLSGMEMC